MSMSGRDLLKSAQTVRAMPEEARRLFEENHGLDRGALDDPKLQDRTFSDLGELAKSIVGDLQAEYVYEVHKSGREGREG